MITFKQYFTEHHKKGLMYKPFNILEGEVFLALYDKLFGHDDLSRSKKLLKIISTTPAAKIFGDDIGDKLSDRLVLHHNQNDIDMLADELLKRIRR